MTPFVANPALADGLRNVADSTTSVVIALLSLLAVGVLGYGLVRAIVMNRRPQIVLTDLVASSNGAEPTDTAVLSAVARQYVRHQITDQCAQIARIGKDILSPASRELELQLDKAALDNQIRTSANDSVATLLAALRAMTPDSADRFLGLFTAILPPPRGASVTMALIQRATDATPQIGAAVEIVGLNGRPLATEIFWEPVPVPGTAVPERSSSERILELLEPVTRWIAVRLLLTLMVSPTHRITRQQRQGLQHLLAGGLFIQAMRDFPNHALTFGEQARPELEQACVLLPHISLPATTLAGVHERMGWARQMSGEPARASDNFRAAVRLWQEAETLTGASTGATEAALAILRDRRLKAQLGSDDPALLQAAVAELNSITDPLALKKNRVWLYNRACLYAQASKADGGAGYQQLALCWLGQALLRYSDASTWDYAEKRDPELLPIRVLIPPFLACLRTLLPLNSASLEPADAENLVSQAILSVAATNHAAESA